MEPVFIPHTEKDLQVVNEIIADGRRLATRLGISSVTLCQVPAA
jgi:hypothetical protein